MNSPSPYPLNIEIHTSSKQLAILFSDDSQHTVSFECLRVYSPSAEVRGHSPDKVPTLVLDKEKIDIIRLEAIGNYALKAHFSDGHNSGIFTWPYLYHLCTNTETLMPLYHQRVAEYQKKLNQS